MSVIDDYLRKHAGPETLLLEKVRVIVKATVPEAEEVIAYGMPGYIYHGKYLVGFCILKHHLGLFPTAAPIYSLQHKLTAFKTSKGGIQFTPEQPIPDPLLQEIVVLRVAEIERESRSLKVGEILRTATMLG